MKKKIKILLGLFAAAAAAFGIKDDNEFIRVLKESSRKLADTPSEEIEITASWLTAASHLRMRSGGILLWITCIWHTGLMA